MTSAKRQLQPDTDTSMSELDAARAEYRAISDRKKKIADQHRVLQQAANVAQFTGPVHPRAVIDASAADIESARRNPLRTARRLEDLRDDLMQVQPDLEAAKLKFERLAQVEAVKIYRELRPAHERAARDIAKALEALSAAIAAELDVHHEFQRRAPMGGMFSPFPDLHSELMKLAWLPSWNSVGSIWGREARRHGYLNDEQA